MDGQNLMVDREYFDGKFPVVEVVRRFNDQIFTRSWKHFINEPTSSEFLLRDRLSIHKPVKDQ